MKIFKRKIVFIVHVYLQVVLFMFHQRFWFQYLRYVSVLVELTRMEGTRHGRMIASQMLDVAIRVQAIRPFAVSQMVRTSFLPWKHVAISFCNKFNVFVNTLLYSF